MTYSRRRSLGDIPMTTDPDEIIAWQCREQAKTTLAPLFAKVDDLSSNWQTTGFYTPEELLSAVTTTMDAVRQAQSSLDRVLAEPNTSKDALTAAAQKLFGAGERAIDYINAAKQATSAGIRVVNAPGFKQWVIDSLRAGADAMSTASVAACSNPLWLSLLSSFQGGFDVAWGAVMAIGRTVLKIGEDALKIAASLDEIYETFKWVGLAGLAGYLAWKYLKKE